MFFFAGFGGDQGWLCRRPDSQILFPKLVSVSQAASLTLRFASTENVGPVSQLSLRPTLVPTCRENSRFVKLLLLRVLEGEDMCSGLPPSSLEANFGPSFSQEGGEATSIPLGTGCGSSSKNKRETSPGERPRFRGKSGELIPPLPPGKCFLRGPFIFRL